MFKNRFARIVGPLVTVLCLALVSGGCGDNSGKAPSKESALAREKAMASGPAIVPQGDVSMSFLPEIPTAGDDIRVLLHGASRVEKLVWKVNDEPVPEADGLLLPRGHYGRGDVVEVTVLADGVSVVADTVVRNSPPEVTAIAVRDPYIYRGVDIEVKPQAVDADGDEVGFRFAWRLNGEQIDWQDGPVLTGDRLHKGDIVQLTVVPFDREDDGPPFTKLEFIVPNGPPAFVSQPPGSFRGFEYNYQVRAVDPDGDELIYSLEQGPAGMTLDGLTGQLSCSIDPGMSGEFPVKIAAADPDGLKAFQEFSLRVSEGK